MSSSFIDTNIDKLSCERLEVLQEIWGEFVVNCKMDQIKDFPVEVQIAACEKYIAELKKIDTLTLKLDNNHRCC